MVLGVISKKKDITIYQLYICVIDQFDDITEFFYTLDCLYSLGKIDYDYKLRRLRYAV
ncbi:ABC-three component system middle component 7 [Sporomusa rhizae]|uniref:ABC-three component system middle component 7 n=1 Tax=Sporomusa rhizae TaxID=357999 RepID=UPI00352B779C